MTHKLPMPPQSLRRWSIFNSLFKKVFIIASGCAITIGVLMIKPETAASDEPAPATSASAEPALLTKRETLEFGVGETVKTVLLAMDKHTSWIVVPPQLDYRIEVSPDSGYVIYFWNGDKYDVGAGEITWFGTKRAVFCMLAKEAGQTATVSVFQPTGVSGRK